MGSITDLITSMDAEAKEWHSKTDEAVRYLVSVRCACAVCARAGAMLSFVFLTQTLRVAIVCRVQRAPRNQ